MQPGLPGVQKTFIQPGVALYKPLQDVEGCQLLCPVAYPALCCFGSTEGYDHDCLQICNAGFST